MRNAFVVRNAEEIAYWDAAAGQRWARFHDRLDRTFAPLGAAALEAARVRAAETVVDIGCGCGASTLDLARSAGVAGHVLGVDVSQAMLAVAERRAVQAGLANVRFVRADAAVELDRGAFDLAFSRFGVMFFDEPIAAFENVRASLAPGGRLTFACWRELAANPWFSVPAYAIRPHVPPLSKLDPLAPGPLAFADPDRVRDILARAGFADVRLEPCDAALVVGTVAEATELLSEIGPGARLLEGATDAERGRALDALRAALAEHAAGGAVALGGAIWVVTAGLA